MVEATDQCTSLSNEAVEADVVFKLNDVEGSIEAEGRSFVESESKHMIISSHVKRGGMDQREADVASSQSDSTHESVREAVKIMPPIASQQGGTHDQEDHGEVSSRLSHDLSESQGGRGLSEEQNWESLCEKVAATPAMARKRTELVVKLDRIVKQIMGRHARVDIFGSSVCGFDTIHSDVDLTISLVGERMPDEAKATMLKVLSKVFRFQNGMDSFAVVGARIPIVKLSDPATGIKADLSIQNDVSVFRSNLFHQYARIDNRFRQLVLLTKTWAKARCISNASCGLLNSFGYSILVLHYLQSVSPPILPRLHEDSITLCGDALRRARERQQEEVERLPKHPQGLVNGLSIHHAVANRLVGWGSDNTSTLSELFAGFFRFYATEIDLKKRVVCVRSSEIPKRSELAAPPNQQTAIWMLDPMDPRDNVARSVNLAAADRIIAEFKRGHELLVEGKAWLLMDPVLTPEGGVTKKRQKVRQNKTLKPATADELPLAQAEGGGGEGGASLCPSSGVHGAPPVLGEMPACGEHPLGTSLG